MEQIFSDLTMKQITKFLLPIQLNQLNLLFVFLDALPPLQLTISMSEHVVYFKM